MLKPPPSFALAALAVAGSTLVACGWTEQPPQTEGQAETKTELPWDRKPAPTFERSPEEVRAFLAGVSDAVSADDLDRLPDLLTDFHQSDLALDFGSRRLGARMIDVNFGPALERYARIKPRFLADTARTSLVISTGVAISMIVDNQVNGRVFVVQAGSLALSTASVRAAVESLDSIRDLKRAKRARVAVTRVTRASRAVSKRGGWVYQGASEVAVIVLADKLEERLAGYLEEKAARSELRKAVFGFLDALGEPQGLAEAVAAHGQAWTDYRLSLYRPLLPFETDLDQCLAKVARDAQIYKGTFSAAERIRDYPALRASIERRYGSIEGYVEDHFGKDRLKIDTDANSCIERFQSGRESTLRTIYEDHRRSSSLLAGIKDPASVLASYQAGTESSGYRAGRASLRRSLNALSGNRIQSYDDELELLELVARWLAGQGREPGPVAAALETVRRTQALDERLLGGSGLLDTRDG